MLDGLTRWLLLATCVTVLIRSLWIMRQTQLKVRRWALAAMMAPAMAWVWFYADSIATHPTVDGGLSRLVWTSRAAVFLTVVGWWIQQEVIRIAEKTLRGLDE